MFKSINRASYTGENDDLLKQCVEICHVCVSGQWTKKTHFILNPLPMWDCTKGGLRKIHKIWMQPGGSNKRTLHM